MPTLVAIAAVAIIGLVLWLSGPSQVCEPGSDPGPSISDLFKIKGC